MITAKVVDNVGIKEYYLAVRSEAQGWVPEPDEAQQAKNRQCLDDFVKKAIQELTILVKHDSVCAYIETKPIKVEEAKTGGLFAKLTGAFREKTTEEVFGVRFQDYNTIVRQEKINGGTVYKIYINLDPKIQAKYENILSPYRKGVHNRDTAVIRNNVSQFLNDLTTLFGKFGIGEGSLVFNTQYEAWKFSPKTVKDVVSDGEDNGVKFYRAKVEEKTYVVDDLFNKFRRNVTDEGRPNPRPSPVKTGNGKEGIDFRDYASVVNYLNRYVIGQGHAKIVLAQALCNHHVRMEYARQHKGGIEKTKSNILLVGPTGSGKTLLVEKIAGILDVPYHYENIANITQTGYVGRSVGDLLHDYVRAAGSIQAAQNGILFLDEVDKKSNIGDTHRAVSSGVQSELLEILDGKKVVVPGYDQKLDCSNILVITSGAFQSIYDALKKRHCGFVMTGAEYRERLGRDDLQKGGIMAELLGRIHRVCEMPALTEQELRRILTEPEDAILNQYVTYAKEIGVKLEFTPDSLGYIAERANLESGGARSLKPILDSILTDIGPMVKDGNLVITRELAEAQIAKYHKTGAQK